MRVIRKKELREMIYEKLRTEYRREYSKEAVYYITQCLFLCIKDILKNGDSLRLREDFTLEPMLRGGRHFYSRFGDYHGVSPMHYVPRFVPHKKLRDICLSLPVTEEAIKEKKEKQSKKKKEGVKNDED